MINQPFFPELLSVSDLLRIKSLSVHWPAVPFIAQSTASAFFSMKQYDVRKVLTESLKIDKSLLSVDRCVFQKNENDIYNLISCQPAFVQKHC